MTANLPGRGAWRAWTRDGVAHFVSRKGRAVAVCRAPVLDEIASWPTRTRCSRCCTLLGYLPIGEADNLPPRCFGDPVQYRRHQTFHRQSDSGVWTCPRCEP